MLYPCRALATAQMPIPLPGSMGAPAESMVAVVFGGIREGRDISTRCANGLVACLVD